MSNGPNPEEQARSVVNEATAQLQTVNPSPFSPEAFRTLMVASGQYMVELVNESVKVSKRLRADTVSAAHVERASEYLVSSTSRRFYRHLGTVGGTLLGAALSNILSMSIVAQYTEAGTILSVSFGIVGAFLIALHIAKD